MGHVAASLGERFNIIVGPRFGGYISPVVRNAVRSTGGAIYQFDPATGFMTQVFP
jgi:hypothetical protein